MSATFSDTFDLVAGHEAHSASALRYRLIEGRVCLQPLQILRKRELDWGKWRVTFYILGASHAMRIERGTVTITELLTCGPAPDNLACLISAECGAHEALSAAASILQFKTELRSEHGGPARQVSPQIASSNRLEHAFRNVDLIEPAWTRLGWTVHDTSLVLETVHSYPQEETCVLSVTTVVDMASTEDWDMRENSRGE